MKIGMITDSLPGLDFDTLGCGYREQWWREFVAVLAAVGYDGVFSIAH